MSAGPTLIQLRAFVSAAEAGSFGRAAFMLAMSPSSLSESVQALERLYGQSLFRRSSVGLTLTDLGKRALVHARLSLQHSEDFGLVLNEGRALNGLLKVAAYRSLGIHLLPPVLALLRQQHPDLQVHLLDGTSGQSKEHLVQDGRADLAFQELPQETPLRTVPLLQDDYVIVAPPGEGLPPKGWADLCAQPVLVSPSQHDCNERLYAHLHRHLIPGTRVQEIEEDEVMVSMVRHGLRVAIMPRLAVLNIDLTVHPLPTPLTRQLGLILKAGRAGLPHVQAFVRALTHHQQTEAFAQLQQLLHRAQAVH
ncbi:LysR family transcriptional regulator (plasmid) [Deinococcus taeanensis]|uniref:LysR family transcriptional regulator n=1 Tax=Deinococcus taeanensis TaxID=2737050 RepID=UPI001CDC2684|nr:LysR family transcriptional regulator [Deinococcus taeanensis]UBV44530.1 LysR family transcriptional regulator [Deinococcus taeanensis]